MKRLIFAVLCILPFVSAKADDNVLNKFPTLSFQLNNLNLASESSSMRIKLKDYLSGADPELQKGFQLVLQEKYYKQYMDAATTRFIIDGNDNEWQNIPDRLTDERGNVSIPNADLVEFRIFLTKNFDLYVMHKTAGRPKKTANEERFGVLILLENKRLKIEYSINGTQSFCQLDNNRFDIDIPFAVDKVAEAKIPLAAILDKFGITQRDNLKVRGYVAHPKIGLVEKRMPNRGRWRFMRMDYTFDSLPLISRHYNYALELLFHLIQNDAYDDNDSMALAMSLSNNWLYFIADKETRLLIKEDIVKHYKHYRDIVKWQEKLNLAFRLKKTPLLAKMFWTNRFNHLDNKRKINKAEYLEFIDRIETLEELHKIIIKNELFKGNGFSHIMQKTFDFVLKNHHYRADLDFLRSRNNGTLPPDIQAEVGRGEHYKDYFGKRRFWSSFKWLNYQIKLYKTSGFTRGCCGTYSMLQAYYYRAMGIPAFTMYHEPPSTSSIATHLFSVYYNPFLSLWKGQDYKIKLNIKMQLSFRRIYWHHILKDLKRLKDSAMAPKYNAFIESGFFHSHLDKIYFQETFHSGVLFNHPLANYNPADRDRDGINDEVERRLGLNLNNPDTDGDGYSDFWELENGYHPNDRNSPQDTSILAIDGLASRYISENSANIQTVTTAPQNISQYSEAYHVKSLSAKIIRDKLYIAITYYNDIRKISKNIHSIQFKLQGIANKNFLLQIYNNNPNIWLSNSHYRTNDIEHVSLIDTEIMMPLSYFKGAASITIRYFGYAKKGNTSRNMQIRSNPLTVTFNS